VRRPEPRAPHPPRRPPVDDRPAAPLAVLPVLGLPEVRPGDDLVALLAAAAPWLADGDVLAVTSKVVSKAEGRLVSTPADPAGREAARQAAIEAETVRVVARRGPTSVVETRSGLVTAAAGVDASNVARTELALLPRDPDASAARLREGLRGALGVEVAVVITDTAGRPWRNGLVDIAIGVAGLAPLRDHRGRLDQHGNALATTEMADADEIASAAELVKGKLSGVPVAVLRGLSYIDDGRTAVALVRPAAEDMFRLGTAEAGAQGQRAAVGARRSVRTFAPPAPEDEPVLRAAVLRAVAAALTAPAPHHTAPWRFVFVEQVRQRLLDAMRAAWAADLRADGLGEAAVTRRVARGDLLYAAPLLVVPCLVAAGAHAYPDARRAEAERTMFDLAMGAGIENFLIALAAEGLGSCWVSSTLFCPDEVRGALELPPDWAPMGAVAVGRPAAPPPGRPDRAVEEFVVRR